MPAAASTDPAAAPAAPAAAPPAEAAAGLVATDLAKRYRKRTVVQGVSVHVAAGEIVGLLGPNGAGKTTSFYMITGLVPADGGQVTLDGRDITQLPMHARARAGIGYLPQEASIFQKLTVTENITAILELRDDLDRRGRAQACERLLAEFRLTHVRDGLGKSLSGGERRRVEIARALAAEPRFVLLDEPFANIDPITVGEIQKLVASLAERGLGVLITDHNVRETLSICTRAYILAEGRVIAEGTPADVLADPTVRRVYLGETFRL